MRYFWLIVLAAMSGCAAQDTKNDTSSPFHKLFVDSPAAQVWVDSRFDLLVDEESGRGRLWLYSDRQGDPDQEFVYVYAGDSETAQWPPDDENATELGSPIGTLYETYGGAQASAFAIPELAEAFNFPYPECSQARVWNHRNDEGSQLALIYMQGASCDQVFSSQGSMDTLTEGVVKSNARGAIKLKER